MSEGDVPVKANRRFDLSLVAERMTRLAEAMAALPTRQDEVKAAIDDLSAEERAQVRRYLASLVLQFRGVLESLQWLEVWMERHDGH